MSDNLMGDSDTAKKVLVDDVSEALENWHSLVTSKQWDKAKAECVQVMTICRGILLRDGNENIYECTRDNALIFGVLFNALEDFIFMRLKRLEARSAEIHSNTYNKAIERTWKHLWDCKERIEFAASCCQHEKIQWVKSELEQLLQWFNRNFGEGRYISPDNFIDKEECTVCLKDPRSCEHISGRIYDGVLCLSRTLSFKMKRFAVVSVPKDYRCRMWPWNRKGNKSLITLMTLFNIDAFLERKADEVKKSSLRKSKKYFKRSK